jgi:tetratricopeptide (TPR) repeat protein
MDRRLVPSADSWARSRRVSLSPAAAYLLSRVDGSLTARQVLAISPFEEAEGLRTLLGLLCSGTIAFASAAASPGEDAGAHPFRAEVRAAFAGLRTRTPHEILGVRPSAGLDEVRAAYARLARRFHPDVLHDPALADLRDELHAVFVRIGEAYNQLRSAAAVRVAAAAAASARSAEPERSATPSAPPATTATVTATAPAASDAPDGDHASWNAEAAQTAVDPRETLRSAGRHFTAGRYREAIALAEPLARSSSGLHRRKARLLVARARGKNPRLAHDAEAELRALAAEDPSDAEVWQALGDVYLGLGLPQRAASVFRRVQALRPRDEAAASRPSALDTGARIALRLLRKAEAAGAELLSGSRS